MCTACTAPAGGTATCSGGACDFTCGTMKKCGQKCIAATEGSCCTDQDCPAQAGKTPRCDTSTNTCSYACSGTTKPCGSMCIPTGGCCANSDCTAPQTCGGGGTANMCGCTRSPTTCTGKCGTVKDNCGVNVDCGTSACGSGQTCNSSNACTCGGLQCTSICCGPPPAGTMSMCLNNGTQCGVQCNTGTHSCGSTSTPCYANNDAQHCGTSCVSCTQPNATAKCDGTGCANTCNGYTFAQCGTSGGKPACGSWNFDSGSSDIEGWTLGPPRSGRIQGASALAIVQGPSGSKAAKVHYKDTANSEEMFLRFNTCGGGVNLTGKRLRFSIYLSGPGTLFVADGYDVSVFEASGANCGGLSSDAPSPLPVNQWVQVTTSSFDSLLFADCTGINPDSSGVNAISIHLKFDQQWEGDVYFDDIQIL